MSKKLFVGSLSWGVNDDALRDAFGVHGEISEAVVISDRDTGRSRGFGFVTFEEDDAADKAVAALNTVRAKLPEVIAWRAASYARLGQDEQARSTAEEFLEVASAGMAACGVPLPESWLDFVAERTPYQRQEDMDHFLDGLRKAGLPE